MVLDLLVHDEEDDHDDPRDDRVQEGDDPDQDRGDGRAHERDQVEDRHDQPERNRVGHAHHEEHERRQHSGDHADQQVPGHVAANGAVDVVADLPPARLGALRQQRIEALDPGRPLEDHEEGHESDRDRADDDRDDPLRDRDGHAREPESLLGAAGLHGMPDALL